MRRYVQIHDFRDTASWRHHPSARLYMYMAMTCNWETGAWSGTRRRVALELGLTDQEYRTAMKNLLADGLIEVDERSLIEKLQPPTQESTQKATRRVTQRATQVTVMIYKQLGGGTSPKEQPNNQPKQQPSEQPSNNNNNNKKTYGLTLARACAPGLVDEVAEYIHGNREDGQMAIRAFLDAMAKKSKVWTDEGDFRAHLMDWALKRWLGAESRLLAANKATERAERQARIESQDNQEAAAEGEARRKCEWLLASLKSDRAKELVLAWYKQDAFEDPRLQKLVRCIYKKRPEMEVQLRTALGVDVLKGRGGR